MLLINTHSDQELPCVTQSTEGGCAKAMGWSECGHAASQVAVAKENVYLKEMVLNHENASEEVLQGGEEEKKDGHVWLC